MKKRNSRYRPVAPPYFVRHIGKHQPVVVRLPFANEQRAPRSRKIFIVKQVKRLEPTTGKCERLRSVLIFDDHPDSLRLVFGGGVNPHGDLSAPQTVNSWELLLVSILTMGALIGMFWPLLNFLP